MVVGAPGDGAFPVSFNLGWHGGVHLTAPMAAGNTTEKVRAIANGTVVFLRKPTPQPGGPLDPEHPLAYDGWTDDGCVVIRHDTEIGEGDTAKVSFFSVYMHLRQIDAAIVDKRPVDRKAVLGTAGQIHALPGNDAAKIHFEIVCDDTNLQRLIGRETGDLPLTADGRTDAVFGEVYFHLPAGTPFFGTQPTHHLSSATSVAVAARPATPGHPAIAAQPAQPLAVAYTSTSDLIVGLHYAGGQGAAGKLGDAVLTTYQLDGTTVDAEVHEDDAEYKLYTTAKTISEAYPAGTRPAPSAVYELLRFGRVLGPDQLTPSTAPHWRKVRYLNGLGWVDLNAANIHKFSDADFPQWKQWKLIDDDTNPDSHCDSATIRAWLDPEGKGLTPTSAMARLNAPDVAAKLKRSIFKFPTEWDASTVEARWGWRRTQTAENPTPMTVADFGKMQVHITALAFWQAASATLRGPTRADNTPGTPLPANHWHFEPREFVRQFRGCRWIGAKELDRVYPNASANNRQLYGLNIAKTCRKYSITDPIRLGHFFGQAAVESGQLRYMSELYNGDPFTYFKNYEKAKNFGGWLGNVEWDDGGRFRGRGFKQMTGRGNYADYWVFRGWLTRDAFTERWWRNSGWWGFTSATISQAEYSTLPTQNATAVAALIATMRPPVIAQPDTVSSDPFTCIDTAGWFWAKNELLATADLNDIPEMTRKIRGDGSNVGDTTPWPAAANYPDRLAHTQRIIALLKDQP